MLESPSPDSTGTRWLLALESSTSHGGAALLRDGETADIALLAEGLRHGRELVAAAAGLLTKHGVDANRLWGVAVSSGPGSYTGTRVGVMSAKALAYGVGCRLAAISSLAAMAATAGATGGDDSELVMVVQDARRDEVYIGLYRVHEGDAVPVAPDAAVTPEEAKNRLAALLREGNSPRLAGSGFFTYAELFAELGGDKAAPGAIDPAAVGRLGWRQLLREKSADPFLLQPEYLRRDTGADWRKDHLIVSP